MPKRKKPKKVGWSRNGRKFVGDDGADVMNAIAAELWPGMSEAILQKFKQQTFRMKPYEMHIVDGRPGECPQMSNVVLIKGEEGQPTRFNCDMTYEGKPDLDFRLRGEKGSFVSHILPTVGVELHWVRFEAQVHVEMSLNRQYVRFFFLEPPKAKWDLDIEVSKLEIPIDVEEMLDDKLEKHFAQFTAEDPYLVRLASKGSAAYEAEIPPLTPRSTTRAKDINSGRLTRKEKKKRKKLEWDEDAEGQDGTKKKSKKKAWFRAGMFFRKKKEKDGEADLDGEAKAQGGDASKPAVEGGEEGKKKKKKSGWSLWRRKEETPGPEGETKEDKKERLRKEKAEAKAAYKAKREEEKTRKKEEKERKKAEKAALVEEKKAEKKSLVEKKKEEAERKKAAKKRQKERLAAVKKKKKEDEKERKEAAKAAQPKKKGWFSYGSSKKKKKEGAEGAEEIKKSEEWEGVRTERGSSVASEAGGGKKKKAPRRRRSWGERLGLAKKSDKEQGEDAEPMSPPRTSVTDGFAKLGKGDVTPLFPESWDQGSGTKRNSRNVSGQKRTSKDLNGMKRTSKDLKEVRKRMEQEQQESSLRERSVEEVLETQESRPRAQARKQVQRSERDL